MAVAGGVVNFRLTHTQLRTCVEEDSYEYIFHRSWLNCLVKMGSGLSADGTRGKKNVVLHKIAVVRKTPWKTPLASCEEGSSTGPLRLPKGWDHPHSGSAELEPFMEHVTLVDVRWLVKFGDGMVLPERRGVITAWQELPSEALAEMSALKRYTGHNLPIVVVSYPWLSKGHPDPHGDHLSALLPAFKALVKLCDENGPGSTFGVLWDFLSLPQRGYTSGYNAQLDDRTAEQLARFSAGLQTMNHWYGHPYTTVILLNVPPPITAETQTPYEKRGW